MGEVIVHNIKIRLSQGLGALHIYKDHVAARISAAPC